MSESTPALTENDRKVFKHYLSFKRQSFRTSLDKTAEATGLGKRTVQRVNDKLASLGVISWIPGHGSAAHGHTPNEYRLADEIIAATGPNAGNAGNDTKPCTMPVQQCSSSAVIRYQCASDAVVSDRDGQLS